VLTARLRAQVWDAPALAALIDGANFLGHAALHAALCAAVAADVAGFAADAAALRTRLALPDDLSPAAAGAVRDALAACEALPLAALAAERGSDDGAQDSPLASLVQDSLLLVFLHLPHAAVQPAALTCAAWAYAGLADNANRVTVRPNCGVRSLPAASAPD
jgi:hypothetical protein